MKRLAFVLCIVVCCLFMTIACDKDDGSGGGQANQAATAGGFNIKITGPASVSPLVTYTYKCATDDKRASFAVYVWKVIGDGEIVGKSNASSVKVKATASGGSYTVKLRVRNKEGRWSNWAPIKARAATLGFVINCETSVAGGPFSGLPALGSAATWATPSETTTYMRYSIAFEGDTSGLPAVVPVTITWQNVSAPEFRWGTGNPSTGSETLNIPRQGATIGAAADFPATGVRPAAIMVPASSTAGTVRFEAPGVSTLTITVVRQ